MGFFLFILLLILWFATLICHLPLLNIQPLNRHNCCSLSFVHWIVDLFKYNQIRIYIIVSNSLNSLWILTLFITINGFIFSVWPLNNRIRKFILDGCKFSHKLNMFVIHFYWNSLSAIGRLECYESNEATKTKKKKKRRKKSNYRRREESRKTRNETENQLETNDCVKWKKLPYWTSERSVPLILILFYFYIIHKPKNQECWSKIKRRKWCEEKRMEMGNEEIKTLIWCKFRNCKQTTCLR